MSKQKFLQSLPANCQADLIASGKLDEVYQACQQHRDTRGRCGLEISTPCGGKPRR